MEFNIGDRVRVKPYDKLPEENKNRGVAKITGQDGVIVDKLWSGAKGVTIYKVQFDGSDAPSRTDFVAESLDLVSELLKNSYKFEFEFLENLVVARLYETTEDSKIEIAKDHGHIFHEGYEGLVQAASYALKKMWQKMNGGGSLR